MSNAGVAKSEALTRAAQKLSAARQRVEESRRQLMLPNDRVRIHDVLESAELAYKAAYKAYTNPFNVVKTV